MAKFDLHKFLEVLKIVGPIVLTAVPGADKIGTMIPVIVDGIGAAEQIKGARGADKKKHVQELVSAAVTVANNTDKVKLDPAEVAAAADKGIDAVVGTINVIGGAKIDRRPPAQMSKE